MTATPDARIPAQTDRAAVERDYLVGVLVDQAVRHRLAARGPVSESERQRVEVECRQRIRASLTVADEASFFVQLAREEA